MAARRHAEKSASSTGARPVDRQRTQAAPRVARGSEVAADPDAQAYLVAAARLVQRLQGMQPQHGAIDGKRGHGWINKERKALDRFAAELTRLADRLELTTVTSAIEEVHDRVDEVVTVSADGSVSKERAPASLTTFKGALLHMRQLAESARRAASDLPNPRSRVELVFAAEVFVHLRSWHGFARPSLYGRGDDVAELRRILEEAGIKLSAERVRNLLSKALADFDPHLVPLHVSEFL